VKVVTTRRAGAERPVRRRLLRLQLGAVLDGWAGAVARRQKAERAACGLLLAAGCKAAKPKGKNLFSISNRYFWRENVPSSPPSDIFTSLNSACSCYTYFRKLCASLSACGSKNLAQRRFFPCCAKAKRKKKQKAKKRKAKNVSKRRVSHGRTHVTRVRC